MFDSLLLFHDIFVRLCLFLAGVIDFDIMLALLGKGIQQAE